MRPGAAARQPTDLPGPSADPIGVVLAGGAGRRIGGEKAMVEIDGIPLACRVVAAVGAVLDDVAVVTKSQTQLPALPAGVARWTEPPEPRHPLTGILHALREAAGRPVLCVAVDLPLLDPGTIAELLAAARPAPSLGVVPRAGGVLQPLCALWAAAALEPLSRAADGSVRMRELAGALDVERPVLADATPFFNVNAPEDVLAAMALLSRT